MYNSCMNQTTLIRLSLAKTFLVKAQNALRQGNDDLSLATAVVDMHDCIDNLLGVLASEFQARQTDVDYLLTRFNEVSKIYKKKYKKSMPNRSDINLLNGMRNGVKHEGVLPSPTQVIGVVRALTGFCNNVCLDVFGTKLEDVSLVSQVKDKKKRAVLEAIEKDIDIDVHNYRAAMLKAAVALFKYLDSHAWNLNPMSLVFKPNVGKSPSNVFPERDSMRDNLELLQYGIDPYLYYRFKNLVPEIGYDNFNDKNLIRKYPSLTWHEKNWTAENARFCLSFLTKLFIAQQRDYGGYHIVHRRKQDKVTFLKNSEAEVGFGDVRNQQFKKGQELYGVVNGFVNGKLTGYRDGFPDKIELTEMDDETSHYEKYIIYISDVAIETVVENYEDMDY